MTFRERRDLWALIRSLQRIATKQDDLAERLSEFAGTNQHDKSVPKGLTDGDEGWRKMIECHASAAALRAAESGIRRVLLRFNAHDPMANKRTQALKRKKAR